MLQLGIFIFILLVSALSAWMYLKPKERNLAAKPKKREPVEKIYALPKNPVTLNEKIPERFSPKQTISNAAREYFQPEQSGIYHDISKISETGWIDLEYALEELLRLPPNVSELLEVLNDPSSSAKDVARACGDDVALTARILKLVNSPFFGLRNKIDDIQHAVAILGYNEIRMLIQTSALFANAARFDGPLNINALWSHSLATSRIISFISEHTDVEIRQGLSGTAGILHDVGKLLIQKWRPEGFRAAIRRNREDGIPLCKAELDEFGLTHALACELMLRKWNLPESLIIVTRCSHIPEIHENFPEIAAVNLAAQLARYMDIGSDAELAVDSIDESVRSALNLPYESVTDLVAAEFKEFAEKTLSSSEVLFQG